MSKTSIITAVILIAIGIMLIFSVAFTLKWDFSKLSSKLTTNIYTTNDKYESIDIISDTAEITLIAAE